MHPLFREAVEALHPKYESLIAMAPVTVETAPPGPKGGVYLFSQNGRALYVGRTKRRIKDRLLAHVDPTADDCPFAWRLARKWTGRSASYKKVGGRAQLLADPEFRAAYERAKLEIRHMDVQFVGENDPLKQTLLEVYVTVVTGSEHNDFDTH